jgi:hypothetical protein
MSPAELRERIDDALTFLDCWDHDDGFHIVDDLLSATFLALKRDPRFACISHDDFEDLTADVRERAGQDLGHRVEGLLDISDIEWAINQELQSGKCEREAS